MRSTFSTFIKIILLACMVLATQTAPTTTDVLAAGSWYVSTGGDDSNDCLSAGSPCRTLKGAVGKAVSNDTIYVATGTYTETVGSEVVLLDKNLTLSGGWDETFNTATARSVIDGQDERRGINIDININITLSRFVIQNGYTSENGGGIKIVHSSLEINNSLIQDNKANGAGGGISILSYSTVRIKDSAITGNTSFYFGGGIYHDYSTVIIENSTISGNLAYLDGGGILKSGTEGSLKTFNATITKNWSYAKGGGISALGGQVLLRNTILAGNVSTSTGPDCHLGAEDIPLTGGYNLVGSNSGCNFIPVTGDLINVDPKLGPLQDNGGATFTHALLNGSLAINAGNPNGCSGDLGNPLTSDQRGFPRYSRCDIGAYEWQPVAVGPNPVFLPMIAQACPSILFLDDFSNPNSGWPVWEDQYVRYEYLDNEYRILMKTTERWQAARPYFQGSDYVATVDVRNATGVYGSYGIIFGLSDDWSQFYVFEIDPNGMYAIGRYQHYPTYDDLKVLARGFATIIQMGTATNQLKIERNGSQIRVYANGQLLNILSDGNYTGSRSVGLIVSSYTQPNVDIRFDNFTLQPIACGASGASSSQTAPVIDAEAADVAHWKNWEGYPSHREINR